MRRWLTVSLGTLAFSGAAMAHGWQGRDEARDHARMEFQRRLDRCSGSFRCREHARRDYQRDLARIDRHRI